MTTTEFERYHDGFLRRAVERQAKSEEDHEAVVRRTLDIASAATAGREQRLSEIQQRSQTAWARRRDELQRQVDAARALLGEARSAMDGARSRGDIAAAGDAAVKVPGLELVVSDAEAALVAHQEGQPR